MTQKLSEDNTIIAQSILGFILLSIALFINYYIINFIIVNVHSPETYDLLFNILPVASMHYVIAWGLIVNIALLVIGIILVPRRTPFILKSMTVLYLIRGFFISMTMLGVPAERIVPFNDSILYDMSFNGNVFFFSGHVALPFLLSLLFWDIKWLRYSFLILTVVFGIGVIMARTHYSIDVFAAPFIVFTIYTLLKRFQN